MRIGLLVILGSMLACAGIASFDAKSALACSLVPNPGPYETGPNDDRVSPTLRAAQVTIKRAKEPGSSGDGDCGEIGSYLVQVDASDDRDAPEELGYSLELLSGRLPFALPEGPVIEESSFRAPGELSAHFADDGDAYEGTIAVTMVDRAGNRSQTIAVHVEGDAVGCGCSMRSGLPAGPGAALLAFGVAALARRSNKRR